MHKHHAATQITKLMKIYENPGKFMGISGMTR